MSTASESINEIIEKLHYEVLLIHTKWEMYRQLFRHSDARLQLLSERTYAFFSLIQRVLMNDIRLSLSKLIDPARTGKHDNLSFAHLGQLMEENGDLVLSPKLSQTLCDLEKECKEIQTYRNKLLAHSDLKTAMQDGANLQTISLESSEKALELTRKYMNHIQGYYHKNHFDYERGIDFTSGADALVTIMKHGLHLNELVTNDILPIAELFKGKWSDA